MKWDLKRIKLWIKPWGPEGSGLSIEQLKDMEEKAFAGAMITGMVSCTLSMLLLMFFPKTDHVSLMEIAQIGLIVVMLLMIPSSLSYKATLNAHIKKKVEELEESQAQKEANEKALNESLTARVKIASVVEFDRER